MTFQSARYQAEVAIAIGINGQRITLTFHAFYPTDYTQANINALATKADQWAGAELLALLSNQANYVEAVVRGLYTQTDFMAIDNTNAGAGTKNSAPMPNLCALAIKRSSAYTGRSNRGRVYVPLVASDISTAEDFVGQTIADDWVDALNEFTATILTANWIECITSRYYAGVKRTTAVPITITGYSWVDLEVDSQRRRMPTK